MGRYYSPGLTGLGGWKEDLTAVAQAHPVTATDATERAVQVALLQNAEAEWILSNPCPPAPHPDDDPTYRLGPSALTAAFQRAVEDYVLCDVLRGKIWYTATEDASGLPIGSPRLAWDHLGGIQARVGSYIYEAALSLAPPEAVSTPEAQANIEEQRQKYTDAQQAAEDQAAHEAQVAADREAAAAEFARQQAERIAAEEEARRQAELDRYNQWCAEHPDECDGAPPPAGPTNGGGGPTTPAPPAGAFPWGWLLAAGAGLLVLRGRR